MQSCAAALFVILASFSAQSLRAQPTAHRSVTLSWHHNSEPDLAGYIVAYTSESKNHPTIINVGYRSAWRLSLPEGRYRFSVSAFTTARSHQSAVRRGRRRGCLRHEGSDRITGRGCTI